MPDCRDLADFSCHAGNLALDGFARVAQDAGRFAGEIIGHAMTWWVWTPSVDPNTPAVVTAQSYTMPVVGIVLVASVLAQSIRIVVQRKLTPLVDLGVGIVRYVVVTAIGLMVLAGALMAGDALSQWMLAHAVPQFAREMQNVLAPSAIKNPFGLLIIAVIALLLGAIQWLLGFFRQAAILVLAAMLPLAAAGSLSQSGKGWLNKLLPWLIALVAYKPMAAFIYVIGFSFLGQARDLSTAMTGIMVLLLALIAMPAMLRFFSWAGVNVGGGGGGVAGALGSFAGSRMGSGGASGAADQDTSVTSANRMANSGPGTGGGEPQGAGPTPSGQGNSQVGPGGAAAEGSGAGVAGGAGTSPAAGAGTAGGAAGGSAAAGSAGSGAAAAGPAGAIAGAGVAVGKAAYQGTQQAAGEMTGGAQSDDQQQ